MLAAPSKGLQGQAGQPVHHQEEPERSGFKRYSGTRVIHLHSEVEKAMDQLKVINADSKLKDDFDLVYALISKLHPSYQKEWDSLIVDKCEEDQPVWNLFE